MPSPNMMDSKASPIKKKIKGTHFTLLSGACEKHKQNALNPLMPFWRSPNFYKRMLPAGYFGLVSDPHVMYANLLQSIAEVYRV